MEIGIIIGLVLGLLPTLIVIGDLKKKRDAADRRSAELEDERDDANWRNTQLESERDAANQHSAGLESERDAANQHIVELDNQLDVANQRNTELDNQLDVANQRNTELDSQLDVANQRNAELDSQLDVANQRIIELDNQLDVANQHIIELDSQLDVANRRIVELDSQLGAANRRITELRIERQQLAQSNDDAIRLLYLATLSLEVCGLALRRELDRYTRLDEQYRRLADAYNDLVDNYGDFREKIKSKARRRLVKKGVGIALAFIPGLALIDILSDLADILAVATEADEAIDVFDVELGDTQESIASSSSDAPEVSESDIEIDDPSLLPLIPSAPNGVVLALQQNVNANNNTPDPSVLDAFVKDILRYMMDLAQLLTDDMHQEAIADMITNLQDFNYQLRYPSRTDENRRQGEANEQA